MGRIVVGVEGSPGAASALRWAVREGQARGWSVHPVLAWDLLGQHHPAPKQDFDPGYGEQEARAALDGYVAAALGPTGSQALGEPLLICDLPAAALLAAANEADLLVVGARGLGGFRGLLLGSVSEHTLHHAPCPVVVVRAPEHGEPAEVRRVVVGVDGSAGSARALAWAIDEGRAHRAGVEAVHAWMLPSVPGEAFAGAALDATAFETDARRIVDEAIDAADTGGLPEPVVRTVASGGAAAALLRAAESAELVVVGSRGRGSLKSLLLGSVSRQITQHAPCPVMVVPPAGSAPDRPARAEAADAPSA